MGSEMCIRDRTQSLRAIKQEDEFSKIREEILTMIWDMEEEIMGNV